MGKSLRAIVGETREKFSVEAEQSIRDVIEYMYDKNVGAVAVREGDAIVGVFSEKDLLRRVVRENLDPDTTKVRVVMSSPVYWISMDERYEVAKAIMVDKGLRHLVILDEKRNFAGFVSVRELLEADLFDSRELVGKLNDDYYEHQFKL